MPRRADRIGHAHADARRGPGPGGGGNRPRQKAVGDRLGAVIELDPQIIDPVRPIVQHGITLGGQDGIQRHIDAVDHDGLQALDRQVRQREHLGEIGVRGAAGRAPFIGIDQRPRRHAAADRKLARHRFARLQRPRYPDRLLLGLGSRVQRLGQQRHRDGDNDLVDKRADGKASRGGSKGREGAADHPRKQAEKCHQRPFTKLTSVAA